MFPLEHFDVFLMFLLLLTMFDRVFVNIFPHYFYDKIKHKVGNRFYSLTENNKPMETIQTYSVSGDLKFLGGLHTLAIREHSSGSVGSNMVLYYTE